MRKKIQNKGEGVIFLGKGPAGFIVICLVLALLPCAASAHIYKYIDAQGVVHFTNTPTTQGYVLYMKEKGSQEKSKAQPAPKVYDPIIQKAGQAYGIDAALIKAVIKAESDFNPRAVSKSGARGLMQIMPENDRSLNISNPFDPSQNIMGGTRYLSGLLTRYDQRLDLALAAYNAGPTAVDRYRRIPPFKETQNYVLKVKALYEKYKRA